jgi:hypothetical protein
MELTAEAPLTPSPVRMILGRVGVSAMIWSGFGLVVGMCTAPDSRPISVVASLIAGVIVLAPVGAVTGLFGGRWQELLVGGTLGLAGGVLLAVVRGEPVGYMAALGVVFGGLVGATVVSTFWRLPRLLKRLIAPAGSHVHFQKPVLPQLRV